MHAAQRRRVLYPGPYSRAANSIAHETLRARWPFSHYSGRGAHRAPTFRRPGVSVPPFCRFDCRFSTFDFLPLDFHILLGYITEAIIDDERNPANPLARPFRAAASSG
jgi:hypothetical protein